MKVFKPKEGDFVIDVGANVGKYTVLASKLVGKRGKVLAIEPEIGAFKILKENIELNVGNDSIEVKALNKTEKEVKQKGVYSYEARSAQFYRKFPLPAEVKPEQAAAVFKNGLLRVEIPKAKQIEHKNGKRIDIK